MGTRERFQAVLTRLEFLPGMYSVSGKITGWTEKSQGREALSVVWGVSGPGLWECWQARKMMQAPSRDKVSHFSALQPPVPGACLVREDSLVHI